ncbi:MAG: sporulation protein YunB, partial [Oscillospiraceae bacterium]
PLGSLTGSVFLAGRGPNIKFTMIPVGTIKTDIKNEFLSAGINQTLHRMILTIEVEIATDMAGYTIPTKVQSSICIGETIIVGVSPEAFTNVENSSQSLEGKLFDYRAGSKEYTKAAR